MQQDPRHRPGHDEQLRGHRGGHGARVLPNREGSRTTASIVAFSEEGDRLVGNRQTPGDHNPQNTVFARQAADSPQSIAIPR